MEDQVFVSDTVVSLFLDMVARALVTNESASLRQILDQILQEYQSDAAALNWPEDILFPLSALHANLTHYVDYHLGLR